MRTFLVTVDYNDADYVSDICTISEEDFQRFLPLIEAIENFKPYIYKFGVCYCNWDGPRADLYEKSAEELYSQFSPELINDFRSAFLSIHNPEEAYGATFHTIVNIQEIQLGKRYVNGEYQNIKDRNKEQVDEYYREHNRLYSYKRKDGKALNCIPFKEMTPEENQMIKEASNLWRKYRPDVTDEYETDF